MAKGFIIIVTAMDDDGISLDALRALATGRHGYDDDACTGDGARAGDDAGADADGSSDVEDVAACVIVSRCHCGCGCGLER